MFSFIIHYWIGILFSLIVTLITHLYHNIYKYIKKINVINDEACLNIKLHIINKYEKISSKGYMTMEEKEELSEIYEIYKKLNCSNVATDLINSLESIPIKRV